MARQALNVRWTVRGNEKMEKRKKIKDVKREAESVTFLVRIGCRDQEVLGSYCRLAVLISMQAAGLFYRSFLRTAKEFQS